MNILNQLQLNDSKPATLLIKNTDKQHIMTIGLKEGQILKKHFSATPALIIVLKGKIAYEMEGTTTEIAEYETFDIPPTIPHEVTGLADSVFLLIKDKA
jgi:quercetin dioxygenase-like cupin family protein